MKREYILGGSAVAVVLLAMVVALLAPGVVATPDEPIREDRLELRESSISPTNVTEDSATLTVTNWLTHDGGPSQNVSLLVRAVDDESGLVEATTRRSVGTIESTVDRSVPIEVTVKRSGDYTIETLVFVDGERVASGRTSVSNVQALTPESARTGLRFHQFDGSLPTITYSVTEVDDETVTLNTTTYLTNGGDDFADGLELTVRAREHNSNVIADRAVVSVEDVSSGATTTPDVPLTVPDNYSYALDAILTRNGNIVDTQTAIADLDPTKTVEENTTEESADFSAGDFSEDSSDERETVARTEGDDGAGAGPGFGITVALVALVAAALLATRWTND